MFTDPAFRELCLDWWTNARTCLTQLRLEAARHPGDPEPAVLVGELSVADATRSSATSPSTGTA